ncbi:MAG: hypothetical protein KatS3mg043_2194 [Rhodothermaceae bacterium]|nr:MAG: hypothetical protein KatS3mg042_1171 [Rhodothermaceae bacterium]GIV61105.1 MAG: hypothetical protein KatS3mg043_2194 [Rhodothermaceae bacterium]
MSLARALTLGLLFLLPVPPAPAQLQVDTLFTWQGYRGEGVCRLRIYRTPPSDKDRTHVVILQELAENGGPSTVQDARYLADLVGRTFGFDPASAYWIFHWGPFSYEGARPDDRRELFLRATFRRSESQRLGSPTWRVVAREEVEKYTDRQFR